MKQRHMKWRVLLLVLMCLLLAACGDNKHGKGTTGSAQAENLPHNQEGTLTNESAGPEWMEGMPWEAEGAKLPQDYTLEEYDALTPDQRKAFRDYLGAAGYTAWLEWAEEKAQLAIDGCPWEEPGAKQPEAYTWAEYQALTEAQKKAFMQKLGPYGLEEWLRDVENQKNDMNPWVVAGAKQPEEYTWAEYQALTDQQKAAFFEYMGAEAFQAWMTKVQGQREIYPWEIAGAKKPQAYTWEEYEALTANQKKAFRRYLGNDAFVAWLESVQEKANPWEEDGAKQPEDYTWEEYMDLTGKQKTAFQEYLGAQGFSEWRDQALNQDANLPWNDPNAKQPGNYSWEDYETLTEMQQEAFQEYLGEEAMKAWLRKITEIPWEKPNAKQPENYTLQEYEDLEDPQQLAFRVFLGEEIFEAWLLKVSQSLQNPWDKPGAKQPKDYTWAEFQALTAEQQMAFQNFLGEQGFQNWLNKVQSELEQNPWDKPGAKQPKDYTWAEYMALTAEQQMAFQNYLGSDAFAAWLKNAQGETVQNPWEKPGAKQPQDYTWAEYTALTAEQQMAFQEYLGSDGFAAWLNKVQDQTEKNPWEVPGAKRAQDYTWEEFQALTAAQQMAFQIYLGEEGFEAWLSKVQNQTEKNPWEVPGAKQPQDYTWEEFQALTAAQQMAFQNYLGAEGFEAWLNKVQNQTEKNPWEIPGAKQPEDYTMEEFEALTAAQQMAFQNYLGEEGFAAWLNRVMG